MKTVCVYHRVDLDGWMSAAIIKYWYKCQPDEIVEMYKKIDGEYSFDFLGYDYGDPIPNLSGYDRLIMCDISFPNENMLELANIFGNNFLWIDHHQPKINEVNEYLVENKALDIDGLTTTENKPKYAACELTWQFVFPYKSIPEIVRRIGRYDCFGHKGTDEEQMILEFQYGARSYISNYEEAYEYLVNTMFNKDNIKLIQSSGNHIYQYLCINAKLSYDNGFSVFFGHYNSYHNLRFICFNKERFNPINFGIDYHKDGYDGAACFYYDGFDWKFSLYNDDETVDVSLIAKSFGGGGHKGAAGFRIKNINSFLKNYV